MGPGPGAPRRLQTFPNSRPTCHGPREGQLSGAPGRLPRPPAPRSPLSQQADRHTRRPGPGPSSAQPLSDPQPSGSTSRLSAQELQHDAGPGRSLLRPWGPPGRLLAQARLPSTSWAELLTCRRCRSTLLSGGAPTRPGCRPLRSPPGQARGGAGASPERRNPPPGQPPPAPGSTRGRAGEGGHGGRRSPSSRTEPGG